MGQVDQEINVNINALVRKIQDVRELVALIRSLRENRGQSPVLIDERISRNARASAGDVKQLQVSIDELNRTIKEMDGQATTRLARVFAILGSIATILGHLKSAHEGIGVIKDIAASSSNIGTRINSATAAVSGFFTATRQKIGEGFTKARETVTGLIDKLPSLTRTGGQAAGSISLLGVAGGGAALALGALTVVLAALLAAILLVVAHVAVLSFMFNLAKGAAEAGSEIHDLSQELAVSAETLSTLKVATTTTTTTFEEAAGMVSKFNKLIGESADGSKEAAKNLTRLGVDPKEALKDSEAALAKVFKRIHELPTPFEKARAAQIAFGKSGAAMVPVIDSVNGRLDLAKAKAAEFGKLLNDQAAKEADEFGDLLDELGLRVEGLGESIGRALIPELLKLLRIFDSEMPGAGGAFQFVLATITAMVQDLVNRVILAIAALKTLAALPSALGVLIASGSVDAAFSVISDRFKAEVAELFRIANTPATGGGSTGKGFPFGGGKDDKPGKPASTFDAELDARRAQAQSEFNLEKDLLDRLGVIYQEALDKNRIAIEDYYAALEGFRRRELKAQIKLNEELQKIEEERRKKAVKEIDDSDDSPPEKVARKLNVENRFEATIAPLREELKRLERAAGDLPREIESAETAALESFDRQISAFRAKVDEASGRSAAAAAAAIDAEFRELLERATVEQGPDSKLVKLIQTLVQELKDRARVKQIEERLAPLGQQFEIDRLGIETRVSKEVITQKQGRRELIELQRKYLQAQLAILKAALAETSEFRKQLDLKLQIANIENTLANLKEIDEAARTINDSLRFGLEDFFASIADGTKSLKEAFRDLGVFILQMFARLAAQRLVQMLVGDLLGDREGQGGIGGILTGIFGGKKAAGDMMSARPGGQLIQVAEAGFDELVVTTDPRYAERTSGLLTEFIRRTGILPNFEQFAAGGFARRLGHAFTQPIPRLAAGAFVPAAVPALAGGAGGTVTLNEEHVHVWDPRHLHREMTGSAGQKTWLHNFRSNKTLIRRELGLT